MRFDLTFSPFACVFFMLLARLLCRFWQRGKSTLAGSKPPKGQRELRPFAGLTRQLDCEAYAQQIRSPPQAPGVPPPRMIMTSFAPDWVAAFDWNWWQLSLEYAAQTQGG